MRKNKSSMPLFVALALVFLLSGGPTRGVATTDLKEASTLEDLQDPSLRGF
jgi:hypothetical protein